MNLTKQREKERTARDLIAKALAAYNGTDAGIPAFTEERISGEDIHKKLTMRGIETGICSLVLINNMPYASDINTGFDLYRLLNRYIFNINDREKINQIIYNV